MKSKSFKILGLGIIALTFGLVIAKIDTSPNWNDTGITAMLVLIISGILGFLNQKYAWLWAILIGLPVFFLNILIAKNYGSFGVLLFSFIGAYAGFLIRSLARM